VEADACAVDRCHGGRDSDYAVARDHRAHELCRQQAQASSDEHAPGRRRRRHAVEYERDTMAYLRFELLLPSEVGGQVMSWSRCLGSHVVIRESGRRRRGIATWTSSKEILAFLRVET